MRLINKAKRRCNRDDSDTYFIQQGVAGPVKIGISNDIDRRIAKLQTGSPQLLRLIGYLQGNRERELHAKFWHLHIRGEWFRPTRELIEWIAKNANYER